MANVESGRLRAVVDLAEAIQAADLSFVGVGTPSQLEERVLTSDAIQAQIDQIKCVLIMTFFTIPAARAHRQALHLGRKYGRRSVIMTTWGDEDGLL
jgi:hypothetical protein